ncbi:MAG: ATP-binding protein [Clostridiales bacterium]|nr:ATP-binding protein [Clostridiales bacterium]
MKKRLFIYATTIIIFGLLCFFAATVYITHANNLSLAKDTVMETTRIYADLFSGDTDISSLVQAGSDTRITVVAPDGTVLADSRPLDVSLLENHLTRPEIAAAASGSPAAFVRRSDTLGVDLIYYALKAASGDSYVFIRAAIPVANINAYLSRSLPLLVFSLLIVTLICFFLIRRAVERIIKPFSSVERKLRLLSRGEYKPEPIFKNYEEIDMITREIDDIALILQENFTNLRDEKGKLAFILNNIGDGLFVADENKDIALINSAALDIFDVTPDISGKNVNYLSYDKNLTEAIEDCAGLAKNALFELNLNGGIFLVTVKRLQDTQLTMVVLSDVTENRENTKRREEFFANASHELKTPLTAIKGFNDLAAINNKAENIGKYIDSISRETDRMLLLIEDMLKLSELENTQSKSPVSVSLAKIVTEVEEALSTPIREKSISFETSGDAQVTAEAEHVYELVKNIAENAVRYNNQGGWVSLTINIDKEEIRMTVADNGIGISFEEQARIFERFYRVEKSRSLRNGGTGLGLSIVKHICALYGWKLSLKSKLGVGTEITVIFDLAI